MPELPEVETTVRGLKKTILGFTIKDVWTDLKTKDKRKADSIANPSYFKNFRKEISGKKIISIERRAKNILINLSPPPQKLGGASQQKTILIHLKMTGHLLFNNRDKFVHAIFIFPNKNYLAFSDIRKFGKITLLPTKTAHDTKHLKDIGPEPLDKNFTWQKLKQAMQKRQNTKIKTALMDQKLLSGIGNIYSDEILWESGVHPERKTKDVKDIEFQKMFSSMNKILKKSISLGGDSMSDYINIFGRKGGFQNHHKAYRKTGERCSKKGCGGIIKRKIINGRSAHFCSSHQK